MKDIMVDLETLGTRAGCQVVSIGAVGFDEGGPATSGSFYCILELKTQRQVGLHSDPDTLEWWNRQGPEVRTVLTEARGIGGAIVPFALESLSKWLKKNEFLRIWGNGAAFDNVILRSLYDAYGLEAPWSYRADRCFRTLRNLYDVPPPEFLGTPHKAIDDAVHQAAWATKIFHRAGLWK